jgi:hypothetical protein
MRFLQQQLFEVNAFLNVTPCGLVCRVSWYLHFQADGGCTFLNMLVAIDKNTCCHISKEHVNGSLVLQHSALSH